jgi:uncharacterized integral membrane protein
MRAWSATTAAPARRVAMRRERDLRGDGDGDRERGRGDWVNSKEGPGVKMIVAIVAIVLLVIFAIQNMDETDVDLLFWDLAVPFWVTIAISALLGFVIGWLLGRSSGKRRAIKRIATD